MEPNPPFSFSPSSQNMPTNVGQLTQLPPQYQSALDAAGLKRALAAALIQRGSQMPQGEMQQTMAGTPGHFIKPSPFQYLNSVAQELLGGKVMSDASNDMRTAMQGYANERNSVLQKVADTFAPAASSVSAPAPTAQPTAQPAAAPEDTGAISYPVPPGGPVGTPMPPLSQGAAPAQPKALVSDGAGGVVNAPVDTSLMRPPPTNVGLDTIDGAIASSHNIARIFLTSKLPEFEGQGRDAIRQANELIARKAIMQNEAQMKALDVAAPAATAASKVAHFNTGTPLETNPPLGDPTAQNPNIEVGQGPLKGNLLVNDPGTNKPSVTQGTGGKIMENIYQDMGKDALSAAKDFRDQRDTMRSVGMVGNAADALTQLFQSGRMTNGSMAMSREAWQRANATLRGTLSEGATYNDYARSLTAIMTQQEKSLSGTNSIRSTAMYNTFMQQTGGDLEHTWQSYIPQLWNLSEASRSDLENFNRQITSKAATYATIPDFDPSIITNNRILPEDIPQITTGLPGSPGAVPGARPMAPALPPAPPPPDAVARRDQAAAAAAPPHKGLRIMNQDGTFR